MCWRPACDGGPRRARRVRGPRCPFPPRSPPSMRGCVRDRPRHPPFIRGLDQPCMIVQKGVLGLVSTSAQGVQRARLEGRRRTGAGALHTRQPGSAGSSAGSTDSAARLSPVQPCLCLQAGIKLSQPDTAACGHSRQAQHPVQVFPSPRARVIPFVPSRANPPSSTWQ